ncbi:hypothetical protein CC86DRAFT_283479 [Ophiobolus disseminans]|uniref:Zn(2)-C6 fungal-type domain-containing protein n=1 Tax=Ophiobolus disseminans TaxID=1469910 RepID=A0A6A7ACH0_9PLEO|nr:hypothetical protein CC86DRAFT_283479 [Ophiobolus disseminans]
MSAGWSNFSVGNGSQAGDNDETPACASCKKRKLRCSRETPTCSHCTRLATDCVYNPKQKPGLKPGAVEALTRRVAFLEKILLDDSGNIKPQYEDGRETNGHFHTNNADRETENIGPTNQREDVEDDSPYCQPPENLEEFQANAQERQTSAQNPLKRKLSHVHVETSFLDLHDTDPSQYLPSQSVLAKVADFFCVSFHHWVPYIHKQRLQTRVREGRRGVGFDLVLHALVAVVLRHMNPHTLSLHDDDIKQQTRVSRLIVETNATRILSVESLQALILIVFDHLNDGQTSKAWPLIGLLTRTIDYLQLTTEPSTSQSGALMKPIRLVQPSNDWTELEERRRLFWIVFLLDRFCSIHTGWNTSLTADDVHRRLPADGGYFTREEPVTTPYFGIWNKAAARIGRSLANVPAQYNEEDPVVEQPPGVGASPNSTNGCIDASKLGAFAYCVEATESLSQVTTFFLQQRINWQDKEHAVNWLTRFKELDLRLVHWKLFLPPKWKDSNISADQAVVDMDPNLTLAHITHNTSMIMLHHPIAFPPQEWNNYVALPRDCSAQTCELAAIETSNIVSKFLAHTPIPFVNAQFAFCAYVAAKALLFDHHATGRPLRPEYQSLTREMWEMSERWKSKRATPRPVRPDSDQAEKYAHHLESLLDTCQQNSQFTFDMYDHSCNPPGTQQYVSPVPATTPQQQSRAFFHKRPSVAGHVRNHSFTSSQSAISPRRVPSSSMTYGATVGSPVANLQQHHYPPSATSSLPPPYPAPQRANGFTSHSQSMYDPIPGSTSRPNTTLPQLQTIHGAHNQSLQDQSLLTLSDTFMDSQFLDMDRVITFEDANFFMPYGNM